MINVLVVDDNPIVRQALIAFLAMDERVTVVGEAGNGRDALAVARRLRPTVVLLDHRMPIASGLSVITAIAEYAAVLVLTSDGEEELVTGMLRGGARGYLVHGQFDPAELLRAVHAVASGGGWFSPDAASIVTSTFRRQAEQERHERHSAARRQAVQQRYGLTHREHQVMELLAHGLSNASIGSRLGLTEKTVKNHLGQVYAKLQVASRAEAIVRWTGG